MRLLLDINILLDVALGRPGREASSAIIRQCGDAHEAWLAWHSLATLAYLVERQDSSATAHAFVADLLTWARVAETTHAHALQALKLPMRDFEDALQSAAAIACQASWIVTRNGKDFTASPVPAISPEAFLAQQY
ncbi:MAG: PIN domain-containing protein [Zoogloeaceae bacterium]|jgi:predicted nucleic acid-binding protein|nr:PIN domain-containing protein [Zoogloeaceae bacterium]